MTKALQKKEQDAREFQTRALDLIGAFIRQRPGREYGNYGDPVSYRAEYRGILRDKHDAERLLAACRWRSFTVEQVTDAFRAFAGRLTLTCDMDGAPSHLDYCTGQYFPTEYRAAACAVLASMLWDYYRDGCMPADLKGVRDTRGGRSA